MTDRNLHENELREGSAKEKERQKIRSSCIEHGEMALVEIYEDKAQGKIGEKSHLGQTSPFPLRVSLEPATVCCWDPSTI